MNIFVALDTVRKVGGGGGESKDSRTANLLNVPRGHRFFSHFPGLPFLQTCGYIIPTCDDGGGGGISSVDYNAHSAVEQSANKRGNTARSFPSTKKDPTPSAVVSSAHSLDR